MTFILLGQDKCHMLIRGSRDLVRQVITETDGTPTCLDEYRQGMGLIKTCGHAQVYGEPAAHE
jgi:hypothetical protein